MSSNEEVTVDRPSGTNRECTVCHAEVAAWPEVMCCHCQTVPWKSLAAKPTPDAGLVERVERALDYAEESDGVWSVRVVKDDLRAVLALIRPIIMQVDNEWLRRKIKSDPDLPCEAGTPTCLIPPPGGWCSRPAGHEGPCAARPITGEAE